MLYVMTTTDTPLVLVHGNPECDAVWGPLLEHLDRSDVRLLSPPGFGAPLPDDFTPTIAGYHDWLVGELEAIGRPVDLVGHDMGATRVVHVAMTRPDLLRSWASDTLGSFDPEYVWHPLAQRWADPVGGERAVDELMRGTRTRRTASMIVRGVRDARVASAMAAAQGPEMGRAIVALYRSSAQPAMARLGRDLHRAAQRPGLSILATRDVVVGTEAQRRRSAARAGATVAAVDAGHWWHVEAPAAAADALEGFWRQLDLLSDKQGLAA
jgi:pimeloyl-ACP methyl ester carboxylesterase